MGLFEGLLQAAVQASEVAIPAIFADKQYKLDVENLQWQKQVAAQNFAMQQQAFDWTKSAQQTAWQREDNAVQRRVQDMRAAGINPVLAAGSAASSSSPVRIEAPQQEYVPRQASVMDKATAVEAALRGAVDMSQTFAQLRLTAAQVARQEAETRAVEASIEQTRAATERTKAEAWQTKHDNEIYARTGWLTGSSGELTSSQQLISQLFPGLNPQGQAAMGMVGKILDFLFGRGVAAPVKPRTIIQRR